MTDGPRCCFVRRLPQDFAVHPGHPESLAMLAAKRWPQGQVITVAFEPCSAALRARIMRAFAAWSQVCSIAFAEAPWGTAMGRVGFRQGQGSWAYLGGDITQVARNDINMNLGWLDDTTSDDEVNRVAIHECGHWLGFEHEQASGIALGQLRFNRPVVYAAYGGPPNYWTPQQVDYQVLAPADLARLLYSPWDKWSIMEYWFEPKWLDPPQDIPLNSTLSPTDRAKAGEWYGPPAGGVVTPTGPTTTPPAKAPPTLNLGGGEMQQADFAAGQGALFRLRSSRPGPGLLVAAIQPYDPRPAVARFSAPGSAAYHGIPLPGGVGSFVVGGAGDLDLRIVHPDPGKAGSVVAAAYYASGLPGVPG